MMRLREALTQAPHPTLYNGAETPITRQLFARMTQGPAPYGPRIEAAIAGIQPGELRPVFKDAGGQIFSTRRPDKTGSYNNLDWNPYGVWHAQTRQWLHGGRRIRNKIAVYSDVTGDYREAAMPLELARNTGTGHWYGMTARDDAGTIYLNGWMLDPAAWQWRKMSTNHVQTNGAAGSSLIWMPNALGGRGGLVKQGGDARRFLVYDKQADAWPHYKSGLPNDAHCICSFHPAHGKILMLGGTDTPLVATMVDELGNATRLADMPAKVEMSSCGWALPHPSGAFIVRTTSPVADLYALWPVQNAWQRLGGAPDAALKNPTLGLYDQTRDIYLNTVVEGLYAYRLPAL